MSSVPPPAESEVASDRRDEHSRIDVPHNTHDKTPPGIIFRPGFIQKGKRGGMHNENYNVGNISSTSFHGHFARRLHSPVVDIISFEIRPRGLWYLACYTVGCTVNDPCLLRRHPASPLAPFRFAGIHIRECSVSARRRSKHAGTAPEM